MTTRVTQYAITHRGDLDPVLVFATRADADDYVARAVAHGHDGTDYGVAHRAVTYGDWAPTTPAPATLAARRALDAKARAVLAAEAEAQALAAGRCVCAELGATGLGQRHTLCRAHDAEARA